MLDYAGVDDSVVVTAISRLGRSVAEVTGPSQNSQSDESCCAPCVKASTPPPPTGRAVAAIMATLASLELKLGRERRGASRESRRASHLLATQPPSLTAER